MLKQGSNLFRASLIFGLLCFLALLVLGKQHLSLRHRILDGARGDIAARVANAAAEIDLQINTLVPVNISISEDLTVGRLALTKSAIEARLQQAQTENPNLFGVGIAFQPGRFPGRELYAPLLVDRGTSSTLVQIEEIYDYTEIGRDWYLRPLKEGPVWQEPHYGQASQAFLANFTSPFFDGVGGEPMGVVFTSMSLDQYQTLVGEQGFGETGYGFLLSRRGAFVSHPDNSFVEEHRTIGDWVADVGDPDLQRLEAYAVAGARAFAVFENEQRKKWVFIEPVVSPGWMLGVVFDTSDIPNYAQLPASQTRLIGLLLVTLLAFLLAWFTRPREKATETSNVLQAAAT